MICLKIPKEFICPISLKLMSNPVICIDDGYTYDLESISVVPNIISPITSNLIDLNKIVPNRVLSSLLNEFKINNVELVELDKIRNNSSDTIDNINKFGMLDIYELETIKKKITNDIENIQKKYTELIQNIKNEIKNEIKIYIGNKQLKKKKIDENINKQKYLEKIYMSKLNSHQISQIFNSKPIKLLLHSEHSNKFDPAKHNYLGYGLLNWTGQKIKFEFNTMMIEKIKNENINVLYNKYKQICSDYLWIKKYVYGFEYGFESGSGSKSGSKSGSNPNIPFIDWIFDNYIVNDLYKNIIKEIQKKIHKIIKCDVYQINNKMYSDILNIDDHKKIAEYTEEIAELEKLNKINMSREYYYTNDVEFLTIFGLPNSFGKFNFMCLSNFSGDTNMDIPYKTYYNKSGFKKYHGNKYYYNLYHKYDREKLSKLYFLDTISEYISGMKNQSDTNTIVNLINSHITSIIYRKKGRVVDGWSRIMMIDNKDFDELFELGKNIIDLIEFTHQDIFDQICLDKICLDKIYFDNVNF